MEYIVRKAALSDAIAIQQIFNLDRNNQNSDYLSGFEELSDIETLIKEAYLYVAASNDEIIGYILVYDMILWGLIDSLVVKRTCRGFGIATALLNEVEKNMPEELSSLGIAIVAEDAGLHNWTKRCGFQGNDNMVWKYKHRN